MSQLILSPQISDSEAEMPAPLHITRRHRRDAKESIQQRFERFNREHPEVYAEIVRFARQVKRAGHERYSIDACIQRVRWYFNFERKESDGTFKINDHFSSRFARLIEANEPDLRGLFSTRDLRAQ